MDLNDDLDEGGWKSRLKKRWESFWELVATLIGILLLLSLIGWVIGGISGVIKGWFKSDSVVLASPAATYTPPKPSRPVGFVYLTSTGGEKKITKWYLRADTVLGPRTKRLFWVKLDYSKDKSKKENWMEMFVAVNCETMEMRALSYASYKIDNENAVFSESHPFDKAKVEYPVPNTGMMASYKEVCKGVYDATS
jgi:hypothetical protein